MRCLRWWPVREGVGLCGLRKGHGGTYCIDTAHNRSHPTTDTQPPVGTREKGTSDEQE